MNAGNKHSGRTKKDFLCDGNGMLAGLYGIFGASWQDSTIEKTLKFAIMIMKTKKGG